MDIKKAIEWQNAFKRTYKGNPMEKEALEACDMAIEALEKSQPKKAILGGLHNQIYLCPNCKDFVCRQYELTENKPQYCDCGQHLDWGGDN